MKGIIMGVNGVNFKSNLNPYAPVDTNAQQRFQRTEPYPSDTFEKKDNKNKNKKIIAGVLGAAAAIGLAILGLKKGKCLKETKQMKDFLAKESKKMKRLMSPYVKQEELSAKLEEISKLPLEEQKGAYKNLERVYENIQSFKYAEKFGVKISQRRGMKDIPKDVQDAINEGNWIKAGELYEEAVQKLPKTYKATQAGETVEETIKNVFGESSKIKPHTYDVANEVCEIRYNGYSSGSGINHCASTTKDGVVHRNDWTIRTLMDDVGSDGLKIVEQKEAEGFYVTQSMTKDGRPLASLTITEGYGRDTVGNPYKLTLKLLSKTKELSPAQKDLLSLVEHPENFDRNIIIKLQDGLHCECPNFDYDLVLSAIQSMAKGV